MAFKEAQLNDFGLLIAYVLPGFVVLWGASYFDPTLREWIGSSPETAPTIAGFLFMTVVSIGAGLTASTVRWLVVDSLHRWTGIRPPERDFALLQQNAVAYNVLLEIHYKYYQFYANGLVALLWAFGARRVSRGVLSPMDWVDLGFVLLVVLFYLGSRDTFRKYYLRTGQLLGADSQSSATKWRFSRRGPV